MPKEFQIRQLKIHVKVPPLVHIASSGGHDLYQTKFRKPQRNRSTRGSREENFQGWIFISFLHYMLHQCTHTYNVIRTLLWPKFNKCNQLIMHTRIKHSKLRVSILYLSWCCTYIVRTCWIWAKVTLWYRVRHNYGHQIRDIKRYLTFLGTKYSL